MRIVIAAGGTGGHIFPAIKFGQLIKKKYPAAEIYFVCEKGNKLKPLIMRFFKCIEIRQSRFSGKNIFYKMGALISTIFSIFKSISLLKKLKPDMVIGAGGFASFSIVFAGSILGLKTMIHEQNVLPGFTNIFLSKFVDIVGISFKETEKYFRGKNVHYIGNPVYTLENIERRLATKPHRILVFGGSQGARVINYTVSEMLEQGLINTAEFSFTIITGFLDFDYVKSRLGDMENVDVLNFSDNMPALYKAHDLVISRAGATTIAEICRFQIPAILIPFAKAYKSHQDYNAYFLKNHGAASVLFEHELSPQRLRAEIEKIFKPPVYQRMLQSISNVFDFDPRASFLHLFENIMQEKENVQAKK